MTRTTAAPPDRAWSLAIEQPAAIEATKPSGESREA